MRSEIRLDRRATWTSGDPVSPSLRETIVGPYFCEEIRRYLERTYGEQELYRRARVGVALVTGASALAMVAGEVGGEGLMTASSQPRRAGSRWSPGPHQDPGLAGLEAASHRAVAV